MLVAILRKVSITSFKRRSRCSTLIWLGFLTLLAAACGNPELENANAKLQQTEAAITHLAGVLDGGGLPNQAILKTYADQVAQAKPAFAELARTLGKEGSRDGRAFTALTERLQNAHQLLQDYGSSSRDALDQVNLEADNLIIAADPDVFGDALVDPINVLADMSDGTLPRLVFDDEEAAAPQATDANAGYPSRHLVGNPAYGYWHGSGGSSFWVWYGVYRMVGDLFHGPGPSWYGWYSNRGPSYYGDVGRHYYAPAQDSHRWANARRQYPDVKADRAPAKSYAKLGSSKRLSTYSPVSNTTPKALTGGKTVQGRVPSNRLGQVAQSGTRKATRRTSQYSKTNTRSNPSRSSGFAGRRGK